MQVGICGEFLGTRPGGVATYTQNLLVGLSQLNGHPHHFYPYIATHQAIPLLPRSNQLTPRFVRPYSAWVRLPVTLPLELMRRKVDLLHVMLASPPWTPCPIVASIHDLSWENHPEIVGWPLRARLKTMMRLTARRARLLIVPSRHTAADLRRLYQVPNEKIRLVYPGFDPACVAGAHNPAEVGRVRARYQLSEPYLLYVGSLEPRKNVDRLIRAYASLRRDGRVSHRLVLAGTPVRLARRILELPATLAGGDGVTFLGTVPQADLAGLYGGAAAFAFLGSCEGFGYPPLEAMAAGIPTLVANKAALPEVVGDAALLADPFQHDELVESLEQLLTQADLRDRLRAAGLRRVQQFDPAEASRRFVSVYEECLDSSASEPRPHPTASAPAMVSGKSADLVAFVCPRCRGALADREHDRLCTDCGAVYAAMAGGYADFAGTQVHYDDWWTATPERTAEWMASMAPKDEAFQAAGARRLVLPLLRRLGYQPGGSRPPTVLSAACGLGADVDVLNDAGYATWGIDCGSRALRWPMRRYPDRLGRADIFALPFPDASFDLVMALNALEHVGVVGDTTEVRPDYEELRLAALKSLMRVTRPGGYVLLSGVARRFPLDLFHTPLQGQAPPRSTSLGSVRQFVRIHSPMERFTLSYGDQVRLARQTGDVEWVQPLPLRGFFAYTNLNRHAALKPIVPVIDWLLGGLPKEVYGSWFSFFTIVLMRRNALGETYGTP